MFLDLCVGHTDEASQFLCIFGTIHVPLMIESRELQFAVDIM